MTNYFHLVTNAKRQEKYWPAYKRLGQRHVQYVIEYTGGVANYGKAGRPDKIIIIMIFLQFLSEFVE